MSGDPRIAPRYEARVVEILDTTLSPATAAERFDAIGPALTPAYRGVLEDALRERRAFVRDEVGPLPEPLFLPVGLVWGY